MTTAYLPLGGVVVSGGKTAFANDGMIVLPAPVVPPVEPSSGGYAGGGGGVRRIRQFAPRKRKREDEDDLVAQPAPQPIPKIPQIPQPPPLPPQPGLMAGLPSPPLTVLRSPKVENDDDEAIALLLETLFS